MRHWKARLAAVAMAASSLAAASAAFAQVPMVGRFTAEASCFATPAIRSDDNPGRVVTEPGRVYELIGRNADPGSHYLIRVPGAEPERRWVAFGCGRVGESSTAAENRAAPSGGPASSGDARDYVLAASWHPAFCETRARRPDCRGGGEAEGFTLHGLWPQPRGNQYCGVSASLRRTDEAGRWRDLPPVDVGAATRRDLERVMPGTLAHLDRHQYWKHGTCHAGDADDYFADSVRLMDALNASPIRTLFVESIGEEVTTRQIRAAFDAAFGRGAGARVLLDCEEDGRGGRLAGELRIALRGRLAEGESLGALILAAGPQEPGCRGGRIDAPGFG